MCVLDLYAFSRNPHSKVNPPQRVSCGRTKLLGTVHTPVDNLRADGRTDDHCGIAPDRHARYGYQIGRAERRSKRHCRRGVGVDRARTPGPPGRPPRGIIHCWWGRRRDPAGGPRAAPSRRDARAGPSRRESASAEEAARLKSRYSTTGRRYRNPLPAGRAGMPCVTSSQFLPFT